MPLALVKVIERSSRDYLRGRNRHCSDCRVGRPSYAKTQGSSHI